MCSIKVLWLKKPYTSTHRDKTDRHMMREVLKRTNLVIYTNWYVYLEHEKVYFLSWEGKKEGEKHIET